MANSIIIWKVFKGHLADQQSIDLLSKLLTYSPLKRLKPIEALAHPFFDDLRSENCKINHNNLPELFNFFEGKDNNILIFFFLSLNIIILMI